jgi:hypothetical protein
VFISALSEASIEAVGTLDLDQFRLGPSAVITLLPNRETTHISARRDSTTSADTSLVMSCAAAVAPGAGRAAASGETSLQVADRFVQERLRAAEAKRRAI